MTSRVLYVLSISFTCPVLLSRHFYRTERFGITWKRGMLDWNSKQEGRISHIWQFNILWSQQIFTPFFSITCFLIKQGTTIIRIKFKTCDVRNSLLPNFFCVRRQSYIVTVPWNEVLIIDTIVMETEDEKAVPSIPHSCAVLWNQWCLQHGNMASRDLVRIRVQFWPSLRWCKSACRSLSRSRLFVHHPAASNARNNPSFTQTHPSSNHIKGILFSIIRTSFQGTVTI
jgi:hypothetical protein